jgi:hypothetical protein
MILCGNSEPLQTEAGDTIQINDLPVSCGTSSIVVFGV